MRASLSPAPSQSAPSSQGMQITGEMRSAPVSIEEFHVTSHPHVPA